MKALFVLVVVLVHFAASAAPEIQVFFPPDGGYAVEITRELPVAGEGFFGHLNPFYLESRVAGSAKCCCRDNSAG